MTDQLPPHDPISERALLGALLFDREAIAAVSDWLKPAAFFSSANATIYRAMVALWNVRKPCDLVTLGGLLRSRSLIDSVGGESYLFGLLDGVPIAAHAPYYAETIVELARRRELIRTGADLVARAYQGDVAIEDAVGAVRRAGEAFAPPRTGVDGEFAAALPEHRLARMALWSGETNERIVPTGIQAIDRKTMGGFRGGELIYIGGRPGSGKTSIALQMAINGARRGKRALIVELEMKHDALLSRAVAAEAGVPFSVGYLPIGDVRQQDAWLEASERLEAVPVTIETGLRTTDQIAAYCERAAGVAPFSAVYIDHLDYLADPDLGRASQEQRTAETSKRLKRIAMGLDIPVIVLSQLNRSVEEHPPFKPGLNHFRYSGAVEQDAEYAFLIYRRAYYVAQGKLESDPNEDYVVGSNRHKVELLVAKHRNGEVGMIELAWIPDQMKFTERDAA
jgi:replicative DNA helicase